MRNTPQGSVTFWSAWAAYIAALDPAWFQELAEATSTPGTLRPLLGTVALLLNIWGRARAEGPWTSIRPVEK